ncbi:CHAT domain-containing protein [Mycena pura]|uniref:CHAT domain-containing protein n=1 Tax=Mycena pura TaxID=153505 RepID=A0AAD6XXX2_9AGAR|nr:CHAT domain-containing protein [Mycena pura]
MISNFKEAPDLDKIKFLQIRATLWGNKYEKSGQVSDLEEQLKADLYIVYLTPIGHPNRVDRLWNLSRSFMNRYDKLGDTGDLEAAILTWDERDSTPHEHDTRAVRLLEFSEFLGMLYYLQGNPEEIDIALKAGEEALNLPHGDRASKLQNLAILFRYRYERQGDVKDLDAAVKTAQEALDLTPDEHSARAGRLRNLGVSLIERYRRLGDVKDLDAAVQTDQEAVDLTPIWHSTRAGRLQHLVVSLTERYRKLGDSNDLEAIFQREYEAAMLTPRDDPNRAGRFQNVAASFTARYQKFGRVEDRDGALFMNEEALKLTPQDHTGRADRLNNLAASYISLYHDTRDLHDLECSLQLSQEAVELTPREHPNRVGHLNTLGLRFMDRYDRMGDMEDLESALQTQREAVNLTPQGHPDRAARLREMSATLWDRYEKLEDPKDLDFAVQTQREVVDLTPQGHSDRSIYLQRLSVYLEARCRMLGDLNDHPDRVGRLKTLADSFWELYNIRGKISDLDAALGTVQEAVALAPQSHSDRASLLRILGGCLRDRYQTFGDLKDNEVAIQTYVQALELTAQELPEYAVYLQGLAACLRDRYERLRNLADLEAALKMKQKAVELIPSGHPHRAQLLRSLSTSFRDRYRILRDTEDLNAAIQTGQEAVDLVPQGDYSRAAYLQTLAASLTDRYRKLGDPKDLEAALQMKKDAVDQSPPEDPVRAARLQNLAASFRDRYEKFKDPKDMETVHMLYIDSFKLFSSAPENSWAQALRWVSFAEKFQPSYCVLAYMSAFALLPDILWIGNSIPLRHAAMRRLNIQDATSAAIRTCINVSDLPAAVQLLEQGLATIFQQMLQLKTDVDVLPPEQGRTLMDLSSQLYNETASNPFKVVDYRNSLLHDIRKQPGFEYFLLPKPYNVLCHASKGGPIVILNAHPDHCDGIIILNPTSEPVHVPLLSVTLPLLKSQRDMLQKLLGHCNARTREASSSRLFGRPEHFFLSKTTHECFEEMLEWLWTCVVCPVYKVLKSHGIHDGRLWWLPTGAFTGLPLHASSPTDEFIHSYTATLGSLLDAYAKKSPTTSTAQKFAVIGVPHTDPNGSNSLKGVSQEVRKIASIVKEPIVQCLEGEQATADAVKLQIQNCSWAHLACHGSQNLNEPTKSYLRLYEGKLELGTILRMHLVNAQFVFLAACETAMGDAKLVNESFHFGGAFIAAGFRGAIGTLWSMNDEDGPIVAEVVYSHLFREGQRPQASDAAQALQIAVKELKKRKVAYERWIPFIHMGV